MKYPLASDWLARGLLFLCEHFFCFLRYDFYKGTRRMVLLGSNEIRQLRDMCVKLMG